MIPDRVLEKMIATTRESMTPARLGKVGRGRLSIPTRRIPPVEHRAEVADQIRMYLKAYIELDALDIVELELSETPEEDPIFPARPSDRIIFQVPRATAQGADLELIRTIVASRLASALEKVDIVLVEFASITLTVNYPEALVVLLSRFARLFNDATFDDRILGILPMNQMQAQSASSPKAHGYNPIVAEKENVSHV